MKIDTIKNGGQSQGGLDSSGGTLTGPLMLSRHPQLPMEAATKQYVDQGVQNLDAGNFTTGTLPIARLPVMGGDVTSEAGSNLMSLVPTGVTPGEYARITVNAKGRAIGTGIISATDLPALPFSKITMDKPTTLSGYGITDAVSNAGGIMTGPLILAGNPTNGDHLVPKQYIDGMINSLTSTRTGDVVRKAYATTPVGFLKCNGASVSKTYYSDLYAIVGDAYAASNIIGSGQPWRQQYEFNNDQITDIQSWSATTAYPAAVGFSAAAVTKNRVYVFGGFNGSSAVSSVYTAPINLDGSLGSWVSGTALPGALFNGRVIIVKNKLYIIGGSPADNTSTATVLVAEIRADGTLGSWSTSSSLPGSMSHAAVFMTNSRIYVAGGKTNTVINANVYSCPVNSDGSLGVWVTETSLPGALSESQCIVTKSRVYLLGGYNGSAWTATVYTAVINANGTIGTWTTGTSLPTTVGYSSSVVTKNRVYLLGGYIGGNYVSSTYSAPINSDGTIGTWALGTALSTSLTISIPVTVRNKIYLIGGYLSAAYTGTTLVADFSGGSNDYSQYYSEVDTNFMMPGSGRPWQQQYQFNNNQNGDITGWTAGTNLPGNIAVHQVIVTKNRVYSFGGLNSAAPTGVVYTAPINADGTLGTWTTTTSLPATVYGSQVILHKNYVYLLGGVISSTTVISTVYYAQINADGTLGTWNTSPSSLPVGLSNSTAFITKNRIYLCGGCTNAVTPVWTGAVYTCLINADGSLGTWTTASSLPGILPDSSAVITKNRVYLLGGYNGSAYVATVYTATINSDGTIGTWSIDTSLPIPIGWAQVVVVNKIVYLFGGYGTNSQLNNVYRASILDNGIIGPWVNGSTLPIPVIQHQVFVTKNKIYLIGGYGTGGTIISSVYSASISEGLNDYSPYYDGSVIPTEPINPTTTFKLPDMSATDVNGIYHYIKF